MVVLSKTQVCVSFLIVWNTIIARVFSQTFGFIACNLYSVMQPALNFRRNVLRYVQQFNGWELEKVICKNASFM